MDAICPETRGHFWSHTAREKRPGHWTEWTTLAYGNPLAVPKIGGRRGTPTRSDYEVYKGGFSTKAGPVDAVRGGKEEEAFKSFGIWAYQASFVISATSDAQSSAFNLNQWYGEDFTRKLAADVKQSDWIMRVYPIDVGCREFVDKTTARQVQVQLQAIKALSNAAEQFSRALRLQGNVPTSPNIEWATHQNTSARLQ